MSTLLKALKRAEQERRQKLAEAGQAPAAARPTQLTLPVDAEALPTPADSNAPAANAANATLSSASTSNEKPRINPLLVPKPVTPAPPTQPRYAGVALLIGTASVIAVVANLVYRPAPPLAPVLAAAPAANAARLTMDTVSIPRALLGAGPVPLQLQLDRRAERLQVPRGDAAKAPSARQ